MRLQDFYPIVVTEHLASCRAVVRSPGPGGQRTYTT